MHNNFEKSSKQLCNLAIFHIAHILSPKYKPFVWHLHFFSFYFLNSNADSFIIFQDMFTLLSNLTCIRSVNEEILQQISFHSTWNSRKRCTVCNQTTATSVTCALVRPLKLHFTRWFMRNISHDSYRHFKWNSARILFYYFQC